MLCQWSRVSAWEIQLYPLLRMLLYILISSQEGLFLTPTLYSPWIKEISTSYRTHLLYPTSVFTWQNLLILLITNPHTTPYYKHSLRPAEELALKTCRSELSRLTACSMNRQLDKETHHFELFFQTHWDAIQIRQRTLISVTSSGGLSHLHREKNKCMLYIFSWAEGHYQYQNRYKKTVFSGCY